MAYYLKADPVGKIFDWRQYTGDTTIPTKLEKVLGLVVAQIGIPQPVISFYHFQYPNASHLLLVAERASGGGEDSFEVNPTSVYGYFERSWSVGADGAAGYYLDGNQIKRKGVNHPNWATFQGFLIPSQLTVDSFHTILN
jgi:hypothetical protein